MVWIWRKLMKLFKKIKSDCSQDYEEAGFWWLSLILVREIFPLQKAMLWNWYRTSFAPPSAPTPDLWTTDRYLERKLLKAKKPWVNMANIKEECYDILESAVQGSDFERERISAVFWLSECPLFPLWHHCKQCPWQKRNTDRSFKWFPPSSSWEPSWASWLIDQSSFRSEDREGGLSHFFLVSWVIWGCSLAKLIQVLSWKT